MYQDKKKSERMPRRQIKPKKDRWYEAVEM